MVRWVGGLCLAALGAFGGCQSTTVAPPPPDYGARAVVELARYEVRQADAVLGAVVHLEIRDPAGPLRYFRIESKDGAWVGHATAQGRFSRRVPFRSDEEDLGLWPMDQGVAKLFAVEGAIELREIPVAMPAGARRGRR